MGSAGSFVCPTTGKSLGVIRSIQCNADGTRVSLLSDKVHGQVGAKLFAAYLLYAAKTTYTYAGITRFHAHDVV